MSSPSVSDFTSPFELSPSLAVGQAARHVDGFFVSMQKERSSSVALGKPKQDALNSLYAAFSESCRPGWDGYDASAASYESYSQASRFIEALPATYPAPEIAIDSDGEVSLEWYRAPDRVFSVSFGANDEITYAGRFSHRKKTHGTDVFDGTMPKVVTEGIRRLLA